MNTTQATFNAKSHIQLLAAAIFIVGGLLVVYLNDDILITRSCDVELVAQKFKPDPFVFLFLFGGTPLLGLIHSSLVAVATDGPSMPRKLGFVALSGLAQLGAFVAFILGFWILGDSTFIPVLIASLAGCIMYMGVMFLVLRLPISGRTIGLACALSSVWAIGLLFPEPRLALTVEPFVWWVGVSASLAMTMPKKA